MILAKTCRKWFGAHNRPPWLVAPAVGILFILASAVWWLRFYDNYHVVVPGELYRSGQMSAETLRKRITNDGLRTVINLRTETNQQWYVGERKICEEQGVALIDFPLAGDQAPTEEQTKALLTTLSHASRPILIHCEHGADRTSFAVALYMVAIAGVPEAQAKKAFSIRYGHLAFTRVGCFDRAFDMFLESRTNQKNHAARESMRHPK